jgi:hypothetical protein
MIDEVLSKLLNEGCLAKSRELHLLEKELVSLGKLQRKEPKTYLTKYDILFRYVSIWLFWQGYVLTNLKPHKVFQKVCSYFSDNQVVNEIISYRHSLKYDNLLPSEKAEKNLALLTQKFKDLLDRNEQYKKYRNFAKKHNNSLQHWLGEKQG